MSNYYTEKINILLKIISGNISGNIPGNTFASNGFLETIKYGNFYRKYLYYLL